MSSCLPSHASDTDDDICLLGNASFSDIVAAAAVVLIKVCCKKPSLCCSVSPRLPTLVVASCMLLLSGVFTHIPECSFTPDCVNTEIGFNMTRDAVFNRS